MSIPLRILTLLAAAAGIASATATTININTFNWTGRVEPGQFIEIKGVNGSIRAEGSSGTDVEVTAEKSARHNDPADVEIAVVDNGDGVTICAVYPLRHGEANGCRAGNSSPVNTGRNDVKVDFTVRVPKGVRFIGRTVSGDVEARDLDAEVEAHVVNGSIHAVMCRGALAGMRTFSTVNGSIELEVPRDINADLAARTVNGHISSDLPITIHGPFMNRCVRGTLGNGGPQLKVSTVNGSITVAHVS